MSAMIALRDTCMQISKSKYFTFLSETVIESQVIRGLGIVAIVPSTWLNKTCWVWLPDGYIIKENVIGNRNRTFVRMASMYLAKKVLVRLA